MRTRALAALGVALALACGKPAQRPAPAQAPQAEAPDPRSAGERENLLNIAYGATVVSRTAEISLEGSALRAIDGDNESAWSSPPADALQTMIFSIPALSSIETVGVRMPPLRRLRVSSAAFETSLDGTHFTPLMTKTFSEASENELFPVRPPVEARYIKVTTLGTTGSFATLRSVQARGRLLEQPLPPRIDGCWTINGLPAQFATIGGSVEGTIGTEAPIVIDGGLDGPVYRFAWIKKGDWGFAAVSVAPDDRHLSGAKWYREPIAYSFGGSWFGQRTECRAATVGDGSLAVANRLLERLHRYPLYGLHFDATGRLSEADSVTGMNLLANLIAQHSSQRFRLVAREYRGASAEDNRRRAQARLDSLRAVLQKRGVDLSRIELVAAGSDRPPQKIENEIMRVLYSVVDIELSGERR